MMWTPHKPIVCFILLYTCINIDADVYYVQHGHDLTVPLISYKNSYPKVSMLLDVCLGDATRYLQIRLSENEKYQPGMESLVLKIRNKIWQLFSGTIGGSFEPDKLIQCGWPVPVSMAVINETNFRVRVGCDIENNYDHEIVSNNPIKAKFIHFSTSESAKIDFNCTYPCPFGFDWRQDAGKCYLFHDKSQKRKQWASYSCENKESHLLSIETMDEMLYITAALDQFSAVGEFLTDGKFDTMDEYFVWESNGGLINNTLWSTSYPINQTMNHCVKVTRQMLVNMDCSTLMFFICEQDDSYNECLPEEEVSAEWCPPGYIASSTGSSCYLVNVSSNSSWAQAKTVCAGIGLNTHLLSIDGPEEFRNIYFNISSLCDVRHNLWTDGIIEHDPSWNVITYWDSTNKSITLNITHPEVLYPLHNDCLASSCSHNGTYTAYLDRYYCIERYGYICELPLGGLCLNGGNQTCGSVEKRRGHCQCPPQYYGERCEYDLSCPGNESMFSSEGMNCYIFGNMQYFRSLAQEECQTHGGGLVSVESQEEQDYITKLIWRYSETSNLPVWTSGQCFSTSGTSNGSQCYWKENSGTMVQFNYTNWGEEPLPDSVTRTVYLSGLFPHKWYSTKYEQMGLVLCEIYKTPADTSTVSPSTIPENDITSTNINQNSNYTNLQNSTSTKEQHSTTIQPDASTNATTTNQQINLTVTGLDEHSTTRYINSDPSTTTDTPTASTTVQDMSTDQLTSDAVEPTTTISTNIDILTNVTDNSSTTPTISTNTHTTRPTTVVDLTTAPTTNTDLLTNATGNSSTTQFSTGHSLTASDTQVTDTESQTSTDTQSVTVPETTQSEDNTQPSEQQSPTTIPVTSDAKLTAHTDATPPTPDTSNSSSNPDCCVNVTRCGPPGNRSVILAIIEDKSYISLNIGDNPYEAPLAVVIGSVGLSFLVTAFLLVLVCDLNRLRLDIIMGLQNTGLVKKYSC